MTPPARQAWGRRQETKLDPLIEETLIATAAMTVLAATIALLYWALTGLSPWPYLILAEVAAFGLGVVLLALASPRRSRP